MESEKEAVAPWKLLCIPLCTHSSEILPGRLIVEGAQMVVKGKEGGREVLHRSNGYVVESKPSAKGSPAPERWPEDDAYSSPRFWCSVVLLQVENKNESSGVGIFLCVCVCGRKQTTNKTIREQPQREWGHLTIELTWEVLLHSGLQPSQEPQAFAAWLSPQAPEYSPLPTSYTDTAGGNGQDLTLDTLIAMRSIHI